MIEEIDKARAFNTAAGRHNGFVIKQDGIITVADDVAMTAYIARISSGGLYLLPANNLSDVADTSTSNHNLGNSHSNYTPVFTPQNNPNNTCDVLADSLVIVVDTDSVTFYVTVLVTLDVADTQETFVFNLIPPPNSNFADKFQIRGLASRADATIFTDVFYGVVQAVSGDVTAQFFINTDTAGNSGTFVLSGRYHK